MCMGLTANLMMEFGCCWSVMGPDHLPKGLPGDVKGWSTGSILKDKDLIPI